MSVYLLDTPLGTDEVKLWDLIFSFVDPSKYVCEGSGFINVRNKTIYYVQSEAKKPSKNGRENFSIFVDHLGRLVYIQLVAAAKSPITEADFRHIVESINFNPDGEVTQSSLEP